MLAAYMSNGYKFMLLLHVVAAFIAFGPLFAVSALQRAGRTADVARLYLYWCLPALVATWVFGMGLVGMSDKLIKMSQAWIVIATIGWLAAVVIGAVLIRPALTQTGEDARKKLAAGLGVTHLLLVVLLYAMVFKPGL